jgi:hypothetical protein
MAKHQDLCFQRASRPEQSDQRAPDQSTEIDHQVDDSPDSPPPANRIRFPAATGRSLSARGRYRQSEKAKTEKEAHGEFESEHPGYCGAQNTFYVGNMKGVDRVYQQTFIDTYAKVACAKLYDRKTPITAADLLNDRVLPFFEEHEVKLLHVLIDRGSEYCGDPERHEYELYLAVEDIDHTRTKTKSPQTNGICERFHKPVLNEFYRVRSARSCIVRSTICRSIWILGSRNITGATPSGTLVLRKKTPMQTFLDAMPMAKEKIIPSTSAMPRLRPKSCSDATCRDGPIGSIVATHHVTKDWSCSARTGQTPAVHPYLVTADITAPRVTNPHRIESCNASAPLSESKKYVQIFRRVGG